MKSHRWIVSFFVLAMAAFPVYEGPLYEPDEGRYAEIGREMLVSGDWIVPRLNGEPHLTKPPFAYWMAAVGTLLCGNNERGARIMVSVAFVGLCLLAAMLGTMLHDRRTGLLAALIHATSLQPFLLGHFLSADVFVSFWQAAAVTAAVAAWKSPLRRGRRLAWLVWFSFGMAFMTKGPPGLLAVIPLLLVGLQRRMAGQPRVIFNIPGLLLFLVVSHWWYVLLVLKDPDLLRYFVVDEVWNRVFTDAHHRDNTPLIYLGGLTIGMLPWTGTWRLVFRSIGTWFQKGSRNIPYPYLLMGGWILPALLVFVFARSRLIMYIGPLFVPLSVLFARARLYRGAPSPLATSPWKLAAWCLLLLGGVHAFRSVQWGRELADVAEAMVQDAGARPFAVINGSGDACGSLPFLSRSPTPAIVLKRHQARASLAEGTLSLVVPRVSDSLIYMLVRTKDMARIHWRRPPPLVVHQGRRLTLLRLDAP